MLCNVTSLGSMPARLSSLSVTWQRQLDTLLLQALCSTPWPVRPSPGQVHQLWGSSLLLSLCSQAI